MPCRVDISDPTPFDIEIAKVFQLLDELEGKPLPQNYPDTYDSRVYTWDKKVLANKTVELCSKLQKIDVTKQSLEMQMWWRDHQKADKERLEKELREKLDEEARKKALTKLSAYEKQLLGLKS